MSQTKMSAELNDQVRQHMADLGEVIWSPETNGLSKVFREALLDAVRQYQFIKEQNLSVRFTRSRGSIYESKNGEITEVPPPNEQIVNVYFWEILTMEKQSGNIAPFPGDFRNIRRVVSIETPMTVLFSLP